MAVAKRTGPFPKIKPYNLGYLNVGDGHEIYFEECGNRGGFPIVFFHGGPGVGCSETDRRFFNPEKWRIILFDQRGSGRSMPGGSVHRNTTDHLVRDTAKLLEHLKIKKSVFFGGSWGSTLALLCAIRYPELVAGMVLRGIFLATRREIREYSVGAAGNYFPEIRERFVSHVPKKERKDVVRYYYKKITSGTPKEKRFFSYEWARYEEAILRLKPGPEKSIDRELAACPFEPWVLIENHYMRHNCFLEDDYIIKYARGIPHVPIVIVQGRYDMCCPPANAFRLKNALSWSELHMVVAGHSSTDPETRRKLVLETEKIYYRL